MIYLLHFDRPMSHARHYIGFAGDVAARLREHQAGRGARITQVAVGRGIELTLVRTWEGGRHDERRLKQSKNGPRLCPICNEKGAHND